MIKTHSFQWIYAESYEDMSNIAASIFEQQLHAKPNSVIGLATGGSPIGFYKVLVRRYMEGHISFNRAVSFNLDEYVGVDAQADVSYQHFMNKHLFNYIDLLAENQYLPNGLANDFHAECQRYEYLLEKNGYADLQLLGIGVNGHIGFNEPGTSFESKTHIVDLSWSTRQANSRYFRSEEDVPTQAITMGIETIMKAKKIVLLAFGEQKKEAIKRLKESRISEDFPASILHTHPNVTIIYGQ